MTFNAQILAVANVDVNQNFDAMRKLKCTLPC